MKDIKSKLMTVPQGGVFPPDTCLENAVLVQAQLEDQPIDLQNDEVVLNSFNGKVTVNRQYEAGQRLNLLYKIFVVFLMLFFPVITDAQQGLLFDRYYITGSLSLGQEQRNLFSDNSAWLQIGKDTTDKGVILPRGFIDSIVNANGKKGVFMYDIIDNVLYHLDGTDKVRYMTYKDTILVKSLISTATQKGKMLGTLYQASSWSDLDDFTSNFSGYTIDGDNNVQFTSGDNTQPVVLSWDYTTNLTAWQMTTQIIVNVKDDTTYGVAQGMFGTGEQTTTAHSDWSTFAHINLTDDATQGGKIYIVSGRNPNQVVPIDSSTNKLTFSAGDTLVLRTKWEHTTFYIYATNISNGSKVQHTRNFGTGLRYNTGKFSVWSESGGFTLDSLDINSETVTGVDVMFIADSKGSCIDVTSISKCWTRQLQNHFPNSNVWASVGDHLGDAINSMRSIRSVGAQQTVVSLYYNDLWAFPADTVIELYSRLIDSLDAIPTASFKMTPQDYPPVGFPEIRARYDSFRTFLYDTYDSSEIIDAFFDMEKCGVPCKFFNAHPSDTGHFVIAQAVINSGKLRGATEIHEQIGRQINDSINRVVALIPSTPSWQQTTTVGKVTDDTVTARGVRVTTGQLTTNSNIGIGTQNPKGAITIAGGDTCSIEVKGVVPSLRLRYNNGSDTSDFTIFTDNDVYFYSLEEGATTRFRFHHGSKNLFRIVSDANGANTGTYNITSPSARFHVGASTTSIPAFKINSGSLTTSPQAGAIENNGTFMHYSNDAAVRNQIAMSTATLTTGSIPFANSSGVLEQDNSNLYWDDGNNELGVGINPATAFHVYKGAGGIIMKIQSGQTNDVGFIEFLNIAGTRMGYYGYGGYATNWLTVSNNANAGIDFKTNNTNRVSIAPTGELGVGTGTATPSYLFTVGSGNLWGISSTGKVNYASGANRAAGTATLSSGTVTVNTTNVTANSKIKLTYQSCTNCATLYVGTITAATSFVINSTDGTDGSVVFWEIADIN